MSVIDNIIAPIVGALLLFYFIFTLVEYMFWPTHITLEINLRMRQHWILNVLFTQGQELLAIQSIRNSMMGSSLFATSSTAMAFGILPFAASAKGVERYIYVSVSIIMFVSFFNFASSVRYLQHLGFLVTCSDATQVLQKITETKKLISEMEDEYHSADLTYFTESKNNLPHRQFPFDPVRVKNLKTAKMFMRRATIHHAIGMRCLFIAAPVSFYLLNVWFFIVGTVLMIPIMYYYDHATNVHDSIMNFVRKFRRSNSLKKKDEDTEEKEYL